MRSNRRILAYLIALLTAAVIITGLPVVKPTPGAIAEAAVPTSVSLASSHTTLTTGSSATLTATADANVSGSGHAIQIWRTSPSYQRIATCSTGITCSGTTNVTAQAVKNSTYKAIVVSGAPTTWPATNVTESLPVNITRAAFSVNLSSNVSQVSTSEQATLQAVTSQSVSSTNLRIFIYDKTENRIVFSCTTGTTCSTNVSVFNYSSKNYKAYVATNIDGKTASNSLAAETVTDEEAGSNVVTVSRNDFTVALTTNKSVITTEEQATLTATTNQSVSGTSYRIFIYNRTNGRVEQVCSNVSTCSFATDMVSQASNNFIAYVATTVGGRTSQGAATETVVGQQAASPQVNVDRQAWTIDLNTSKDTILTTDNATLTANTNQSITGSNYRIYIYDRTISRVMASCSSGASCTVDVNFKNEAHHDYVAYVAKNMNGTVSVPGYSDWPAVDNPGDLQAESNELRVDRAPFTVRLFTDKVLLDSQESASLQAIANQSTAGTNLHIFIYDRTDKTILGECVSDICSRNINLEGYSGDEIVAYIAQNIDGKISTANTTANDVPNNLQATSKKLRVTSKQWHVTMTKAGNVLNAKTNQSVSNSLLSIFIVNKADQYIRAVCQNGTVCSYTRTQSEVDDNDEFVVQVAQTVGNQNVPTKLYFGDEPANYYASSNGFSAPMGSAYYDEPFKPAAAGNAIPQACLCNIGDPVNLQTGALTEDFTDLAIPDKGYALQHDRSYKSSFADVKGSMGNGWTFLWDAHIDEDANENITLTFDDWSKQEFTKITGGYESKYYSFDKLVKRYDSTNVFIGWKLTRKSGEKWLFNVDGKLERKENVYGQYIEAGYDINGNIISVETTSGQQLTYTTSNSLVTSVESPGGRLVEYNYDSNANLTKVTYPDGTDVEYDYDSNDRLTEISNRKNNTTTNVYDDQGRVTEQTNALNETLAITYASDYTEIERQNGRKDRYIFQDGLPVMNIIGVGEIDERASTFTYDPMTLMVKSVQDEMGNIETYSYDQVGNMVSKTDFGGQVYSWIYNSNNVAVSQTLPNGNVQTFTVDNQDRVTNVQQMFKGNVVSSQLNYGTGVNAAQLQSTTDYNGMTSNAEYDNRGNVVASISPGATTRSRTEYSYDVDGHLVETVDAYGAQAGGIEADHKIINEYDDDGRVTSTTLQNGAVYSYDYDAQGNVVTETDPMGYETTYTYDVLDRVKTVTTPDAVTRTLAYDESGNIISITDADNNVLSYTYDIYDNLVQIETPEGRITTSEYDLLDRPTKITNARSGEELFTYDSGSRLLSYEGPTGGISTYSYNAAGELATSIDPNGNETTYAYDSLGQPTTTAFEDSTTQSLNMDAESRLLSRTNQIGKTDTYNYNARGLLDNTEEELGRTTSFEYDIAGLPTKMIFENGKEVIYSYDEVGNLVEKDYSDSTHDVTYTYNLAGDKLTMVDGTGTTTYGHDVYGRLNSIEDGNGNEVSYTYNNLGQISTVAYPSGYSVTKNYDNDGLLTSTVDSNSQTFSYEYDEMSLLKKMSYPNGTTENITRDIDGQVSNIVIKDSLNTTLAEWTYNVLPSGQIAGITDSLLANTRNFAYDDLNRLTTGQDGGYGYDSAGRITGLADGSTLSYNGIDELVDRKDASNNVVSTYDFDAVGNRTSDTTGTATTAYAWDSENRLKTHTPASGPATSYEYDGAGTRVAKTAGAVSEEYVWDHSYGDEELIEDGQQNYVYGPNGIPVAQVDKTTGDYIYYGLDATSSIRVTTDDTGAVVGEASFTPYGETIGTNTTTVAFGFAGEYEDASGLIYLRARYYDPKTAQFLSVDPAYHATWDRYGYAGGNPLSMVDPAGLAASTSPLDQIMPAVKGAYTASRAWAAREKNLLIALDLAIMVASINCARTAVFCSMSFNVILTILDLLSIALTIDCSNPSSLLFSLVPGGMAAKKFLGKAGKRTDKPSAKKSNNSDKQSGSTSKDICPTKANSFTADTLVLLANGSYRKIKDLKPGDKVMAKDPKTGKLKPKAVTDLIRHLKSEEWRTLEFSDGSQVKATNPHPFWEPELEQWVEAKDLIVGSQVETDQGERLAVASVVTWTGLERSYNLTVADYHTYFVTQSDIWVHNSNKICRISSVDSDWATKGAHAHIDGKEVGIRPDHLASIMGVPLRMKNGMPNQAQINKVIQQIKTDPRLRADLILKIKSAMDDMATHNWGNTQNRGREMRELLRNLENMG